MTRLLRCTAATAAGWRALWPPRPAHKSMPACSRLIPVLPAGMPCKLLSAGCSCLQAAVQAALQAALEFATQPTLKLLLNLPFHWPCNLHIDCPSTCLQPAVQPAKQPGLQPGLHTCPPTCPPSSAACLGQPQLCPLSHEVILGLWYNPVCMPCDCRDLVEGSLIAAGGPI